MGQLRYMSTSFTSQMVIYLLERAYADIKVVPHGSHFTPSEETDHSQGSLLWLAFPGLIGAVTICRI